MRNWNDEEDDYDYAPNEFYYLSRDNPKKYKALVESNLDEGDTVERWEERNLKAMQKTNKKSINNDKMDI